MAAEEAELLGVREEQARARAQTTLLVLLAGSVVAVALVGSALWMIRRDLAGRRRAEAALRHNEASLQAILDHTAVTIYLKDLDGRLLLVNRRFEELSQLPRSAIVGRLDSELFTGATLAVFRANDEDVLAATAPLSFERTVTIDDRLYTFLSIKSALRDEEGVPYAICVVSTDITERKHAEEEAQRLQLFLDSIIENIPNMIFVKDAQELRFVRLNRAGEALLGFGREELLGKSDYDFFPKEEADFFTGKDRQVLETGDPTDIPEESLATRDRGVRILHTKKVPIRDRHGTPQY